MSTLPAQPPAPSPGPGDLVRFVEPAGRRRNRVGTVERRISRGRKQGALVVRVAGEARRYVLPADRLQIMAGAEPAPESVCAPAAPPAPPAASARHLAPAAPIARAPAPPPAPHSAPAAPIATAPSPAPHSATVAPIATGYGEALRLFD